MHDIWSVKAFSEWLGQQPPEEEYNYVLPFDCAATRYLKSLGFTNKDDYLLEPERLRELGWDRIVNTYPMTMGSAYRRSLPWWRRWFA